MCDFCLYPPYLKGKGCFGVEVNHLGHHVLVIPLLNVGTGMKGGMNKKLLLAVLCIVLVSIFGVPALTGMWDSVTITMHASCGRNASMNASGTAFALAGT